MASPCPQNDTYERGLIEPPAVYTRRSALQLLAGVVCASRLGLTQTSLGSRSKRDSQEELSRWLAPQNWVKQKTPVISLGKSGEFDDMHVFAPCVAKENGQYYLWYSGSRGTVAQRIFRLGLATSEDAVEFTKVPHRPVYEFGDGNTSVCTAAVLRQADGTLIREDGKLRMWFSGQRLNREGGKTILYEVRGDSPEHWGKHSEPLLENCYAPTVIKDGGLYRMWFVDVSIKPWVIRHASSGDGQKWIVTRTPAITVDPAWKEKERLVHYPTVVKADGVYLMWYSSRYWWGKTGDSFKTAVNFAVSMDGLTWHKHPGNPVMRPDPSLPWESYFNSSLCVLRLGDGRWRIWYGGRKAPPWLNQYFSIASATWKGPSS